MLCQSNIETNYAMNSAKPENWTISADEKVTLQVTFFKEKQGDKFNFKRKVRICTEADIETVLVRLAPKCSNNKENKTSCKVSKKLSRNCETIWYPFQEIHLIQK